MTLATRLETGLRQAIADGSFDKLFQEYYADLIQKADLEHRLVFELKNPILPPETRITQKELWYHQ